MVRSILTRVLIGTNLASRVLHDGSDRRVGLGQMFDCFGEFACGMLVVTSADCTRSISTMNICRCSRARAYDQRRRPRSPEYAGTKQKIALISLETEDGKPAAQNNIRQCRKKPANRRARSLISLRIHCQCPSS